MSALFRHYKGDYYLFLFRAKRLFTCADECQIMHNGDERVATDHVTGRGMALGNYLFSASISTNTPRVKDTHVAVYVSLGKGTIHVRDESEWDEYVIVSGVSISRFQKIEGSIHAPASAFTYTPEEE